MNGLLAKETRALLPVWGACLAAFGGLIALRAWGAVSDGGLQAFGMLTYGGACLALGALSVGHEYSHGTLALLLSQPSRRVTVFTVKQAVLALMLLSLTGVAWGTVFHSFSVTGMVMLLAVLSGLCLAPWLTMLSRNPLAGAVFPIPLTGWTWLLVDRVVAEPAKLVVFGWVMVAMCAVSGVLGWWTFMRLEAIEGPGPHLHIAWNDASAVPRLRHPTWAVIRKELGLQQMAFVLAALYAIGAFRVVGHVSDRSLDVFVGLTALYSLVLPLLIGASASAEERQLGTLAWHQLLPMASWKQWTLKVTAVLGLSLLLGMVLPAMILLTTSGAIRLTRWYALGVVLLTAIGLYVSSLSSSGLRALFLSSAVLIALLIFCLAMRIEPWPLTPINGALLIAFVALLVRLGFDNHRTADRSPRRVCTQLFILWGCLALEIVIGGLAAIG
jgi:hypothetical protein